MRGYRLTTPANRDLVGILAYLERHSHAAARRFLDSLQHSLELAAKFPDSGSLRPELGQDRLRYLKVGDYIVAYMPEHRPISVARILHGARDLGSELGKKPEDSK